MPYIFPGLGPFVDRVAQGRDLQQIGKARDLWHCKQIQDALGQIPRLDRESQKQLLTHALRVRESLAVALEGVDAAITEVAEILDLSLPRKPARSSASSTKSVTKKIT